MSKKSKLNNAESSIHFMYVPFTGLGLYKGFRGNRWLKNRIKIFRQFVLPSLLAQSDKNFVLWISWRYEEKSNLLVHSFLWDLKASGLNVVFTYGGCMFWDDKYPDDKARERLLMAIHNNIGELLDTIGEAETIIWTLQPSDDCYHKNTLQAIKEVFKQSPMLQAFGFQRGYVMNYNTGELAEWNPSTNPPFFSIKFPREMFLDPLKHAEYTGPYKSHEYIGDKLRYVAIDQRGFLVGTHGENISTIFNHPFAGKRFENEERTRILEDFGLNKVEPLKIKLSIRRIILRKFSPAIQRKLRYWIGERFWAKIYEFLRS